MKDVFIKFTTLNFILNLFKSLNSFLKIFKLYFSNLKSLKHITDKILYICKFFTYTKKIKLNTGFDNFKKMNNNIFEQKKCQCIKDHYKLFLIKSVLKIIQIIKEITLYRNLKRTMLIIVGKKNINLIWQTLSYLLEKPNKIRIKLLFINKNIKQSRFLKEIHILEKQNDNFKTINLIKKKQVLIDKNFIHSQIGNPEIGKIIVTSGLKKDNVFIFKILHDLGFSKKCIVKI
nr:HAN_1g84 [Cryptomonas curvata]